MYCVLFVGDYSESRTAKMASGTSAAKTQQIALRKRKHSSGENFDSETVVQMSDSYSRKEHRKMSSKRRKNTKRRKNKNEPPATVVSSSSKKKPGAKKMKRKRNS